MFDLFQVLNTIPANQSLYHCRFSAFFGEGDMLLITCCV